MPLTLSRSAPAAVRLTRFTTSQVWLPFWACSVLLLVLVAAVVVLQMVWSPGIGYNNIYVPDGYTYFNFLQDEFQSPDYFSFIFDATPSPGIYILYYPFFLLSDKLCVVPNVLMLIASIFLCVRVFRPFGVVSVWLACLAVTLNPYTLLAATGPNKETPVALFILLFLHSTITQPSVPWALGSILLTGLMRAPFGLMLAGSWLITLAFRRTGRLGLLGFSVPVLLMVFFRFIYDAPDLQQKLLAAAPAEVAQVDHFSLSMAGLDNPWIAMVMYVFRCLGNAFSMMVRFSLVTDYNEVALLGTGYWIYGIALSFGMMNVLFWIWDRLAREVSRRLGGPAAVAGRREVPAALERMLLTVVFFWLCVSINLFIHPRYLMPLLPVLFGILGATMDRRRLLGIVGCLGVGAALFLGAQAILGFADAPKVIHEDFKPEYLP